MNIGSLADDSIRRFSECSFVCFDRWHMNVAMRPGPTAWQRPEDAGRQKATGSACSFQHCTELIQTLALPLSKSDIHRSDQSVAEDIRAGLRLPRRGPFGPSSPDDFGGIRPKPAN